MKRKLYFFVLSLILYSICANSAFASVALFESFTSCEKPEGWSVQNFGVDNGWYFKEDVKLNETGGVGCYAIAKSELYQNVDTVLVTPSISCLEKNCEVLSFKYDILSRDSETEFIVDISTDEGTSWSEIWRKQHEGDVNDSYKTESIDIKAEADAQPNVQLRFHYTASDDWWWQIDDVKVASQFNWLLFMPAIIAKPIL